MLRISEDIRPSKLQPLKGNWPFIVRLELYPTRARTEFYQCGASVVNWNWILTAAHCLDDIESADVVIGSWSQGSWAFHFYFKDIINKLFNLILNIEKEIDRAGPRVLCGWTGRIRNLKKSQNQMKLYLMKPKYQHQLFLVTHFTALKIGDITI